MRGTSGWQVPNCRFVDAPEPEPGAASGILRPAALNPFKAGVCCRSEDQNMKLNSSITVLSIAAVMLLGCKQSDQRVPKADGTDSTTKQDVRGAMADAGTTFDEQKRKAETKWSEQLKDLDGKMAELKTKAQSAGDKAKAEWETQRPKLESQRAEASKRLDEIKSSSKETWAEVSAKSEAAFAELQKGFKEAWAKLTQ
jgi:hypothetical protein